MPEDKPKLILMDGNSLANRAFYALPLLSNAQGQHTNAVYGFMTMLLRLLEEENPSHLLVAFDAGKITFRHQKYQEYKGARQKTPPELSEQFPLLKEALEAMSVPTYELEGWEADDIIGTLAKRAEEADFQVLIVTGDRDLLQLVSPRTKVLLTRKGITQVEAYGMEEIREKYGLAPEQIVDLKGLMGDSSDNIPGIPGVGEKTALKLLAEYHSVEGILEHAESLKGKLKERVKEHAELARLSKELATIACDAPLPLELEELKRAPFDPDRVLESFRRLSFESLIERLGLQGQGSEEQAIDVKYQRLSPEEAREAVQGWMGQTASVWVEWAEEQWEIRLIGMAVYLDHQGFWIDAGVFHEVEPLQQWWGDPHSPKQIYDAKRTMVNAHWLGVPFRGVAFDLLLASYLLNPTLPRHELSDIAKPYQFSLPDDEVIFGKGAKRKQVSEEEHILHLVRKAWVIRQLVPLLREELDRQELMELFSELEMPLSRVLALLEIRGFRVDRQKLVEMGESLSQRLEELTQEIYRLAGTPFNINSPKQLGEILFDKLGLTPLKKTKTGYSTSADVLEKLAPQHEIVEKILYFRQLGKLKSTYIDGLLKVIHPKTEKVHTSFNQAITATGRLSSTEPNLQNIPIRMEEGRRIRQAFVPDHPDWLILSADYSQIELRILAHLSGDERMLEAFHTGMDIHTKTAMDVFGVREEEVTPEMRRQAKAVNFGIIYGISDYGLSQNLNISRKAAAEFIDKYFETFPGVRSYMEGVVAKARADGYVTTTLKRRRYLPDINSSNYNLRAAAERTAMNTPIQGSAADIIKLAMVRLEEEFQRQGLYSRMLLQVHDELIFEVAPQEMERVMELVRSKMENAVQLRVPLKVEIHVGSSWYDAK